MGTRIHHVSYGEGTPVLAIHGWTPDHRLMTGCLEPVFAGRPGYRRIYPDLPGMGQSPAGDVAGSDDMVDTLLELVDAELGREPFLLLGQSYGGYLARGIVAARPSQVLGLALICPVGTELENARRDVPDAVVMRRDPELLDSLDPAERAEFAEVAVVESAETLKRFRADIAPGLALADEAALQRIRANWQLTLAPESGPPYERPTLVLTGRQDQWTGFAEQFTLLPHYPRASYAVLDLAGHNLHFEQPALFGALVAEWLDRVSSEVPGIPGTS